MATVFKPDATRLEALGYGRIAHVPVLFDRHLRYCRVHNVYLRVRAKLEWHPLSGAAGSSAARDYPRPNTILRIAYSIANFIDWCEVRQVAWQDLSYDQVLAYQDEQTNGAWSARKNRKLKPATANARADEATHFLRWAAEAKLRPPFGIRTVTKNRAIRSSAASIAGQAAISVRAGRVREEHGTSMATLIFLPRAEEVRAWLRRVAAQRGYVKALTCRVIIETGLRKSELVALTTGQVPDAKMLARLQADGRIVAPMPVTETKGGRPRTIQVPLPLAAEIRNWIDTRRLTLARRFQRRTGKAASDRLFLSDARGHEGTVIEHHTVYRCFHEVKPRPRKWSPHFARHTFACFYLIHALESEAKAANATFKELGADWVQSRGRFWLDTLRRQLGHVSENTTDIYLRWLATATGITELANGWHAFLEADDDQAGAP
ncbi:site-specific integrase [Methylobacterium sp. WL116]|uniref:tyrosine-type recombinase/integrase n=1 Tax=Methylobacterium sp. WL116 TaxID=2603889 RepID=UPI0011CA55C7|nr:site-specific integrase [Methylobacterium sp. WL116]TXM95310.1 site-specific integrase [Methylobacterium sp. WL116]